MKIESNNKGWGFWGAAATTGRLDVQAAWDEVAAYVMAEHGLTADQARQLLDSRFGRHLADAMASGGSVAAIAARWPEWFGGSCRGVKQAGAAA